MTINIDGYNINYKISGSGKRTAVMLQGWGTTLAVYDSVAAALGDEFRLIQFDFPGFGDSDEPKEAWNVDAYTEFFCKFMQALGIKKTSLIGHSYGGRVIIKLASNENTPFEIEKIVLIDSAGIVSDKTFSQKMKIKRYKLLKKFYFSKWASELFPAMVEEWKSRQGSEDYRNASPIMKQCLVMAVNEDERHLLPAIKQETLLIWGDLDTATPMRDAHIMEEKIPNSGLVVLEGTGHFSFLEQPAVFRSVIRSFFKIGERK